MGNRTPRPPGVQCRHSKTISAPNQDRPCTHPQDNGRAGGAQAGMTFWILRRGTDDPVCEPGAPRSRDGIGYIGGWGRLICFGSSPRDMARKNPPRRRVTITSAMVAARLAKTKRKQDRPPILDVGLLTDSMDGQMDFDRQRSAKHATLPGLRVGDATDKGHIRIPEPTRCNAVSACSIQDTGFPLTFRLLSLASSVHGTTVTRIGIRLDNPCIRSCETFTAKQEGLGRQGSRNTLIPAGDGKGSVAHVPIFARGKNRSLRPPVPDVGKGESTLRKDA